MPATPIRLAITQGDPAGIGPEIILRALRQWKKPAGVSCRVIGDRRRLLEAARRCGLPAAVVPPVTDSIAVPAGLGWGKVSAAAGRSAGRCIERAIDLAMRGEVDGIVTAPIHKEAFRKAGYRFQGHTDMLEALTKSPDTLMLLTAKSMRVAVLSHHIPLRAAPARVTREAVIRKAIALRQGLRMDFGIAKPRIAIAGLNPHAGEGGQIGTEENTHIRPALRYLQTRFPEITGPYPPDTVFLRHARGEFDAVLAMYHDQGLIPLKLHGFGEAVNLTLGLSFVRTSVDHGTAFDIAGRGEADPGSMLAALRLAVELVRRRRNAFANPA